MNNTQETAGEDLIADFLEEKGIVFKRYYQLPNLKGDDKEFREADFYLPQYKVCLEFLGMWHKEDSRKKYKQKMAIYDKNLIPCIYLWPDNLGTLEWMFKRRLRETLLKYNEIGALLRYEIGNYVQDYGPSVFVLGGLIYLAGTPFEKALISVLLILFLCHTIWKHWTIIQRIKKSKWAQKKVEDTSKNQSTYP